MDVMTKERLRRRAGRKDRPASDERGFILLIVMILIVALTLLGLAANRNIVTDIGIAANHAGSTKSLYGAEAAADVAFSSLLKTLQTSGTVPSNIAAPSITGYTIPSVTVETVGSPVLSKLTKGMYKGLNSWTQKYRLWAEATDSSTNAKTRVTLDVDNQLIPIFQFGIFYNQDLEIQPGANLTVPQTGWIHSNRDLYMSTSASISILSRITSAGEIRHGRKDGDPQAVGGGNVKIYESDGTTSHNLATGTSYKSGTNWVDNTAWSGTVTQWGGQVASSDEGVTSLNLPLPEAAASDPSYILKDETNPQSMGAKAAVIIEDGTAKDAAGNTLDAGGSITAATSLYDYREGKYARTWDIDMQAFQASAAGQYLKSTTPAAGGTAGVLYVTSAAAPSGKFSAVRLKNGATLGSPLTVATDQPIYVQGDYNKNSPQPAAILSDATTILSGSWKDTYTPSTTLSGRTPTDITLNVDIMSGNSATTAGGYGGGFENFLRFQENWTGHTFSLTGSVVCMWESKKTFGTWKNTGVYYNAPNRVYTFNSGQWGGKWPPGTPCLLITTRGTWQRQYYQ